MFNPAYFLAGLLLAGMCSTQTVHGQEGAFVLRSKNMMVGIGKNGKISGVVADAQGHRKTVTGWTQIRSFQSVNNTGWQSADKKTVYIKRLLHSDSLNTDCTLLETFRVTQTSIRWEMDILGAAADFSAAIQTIIHYPVSAGIRCWMAWAQPMIDSAAQDSLLTDRLYPYKNKPRHAGWVDPLIPMPFVHSTYFYGAPPFNYDDVKDGFIPFQANLFSIPFITVMDSRPQTGFSIFLSPEDRLVALQLETDKAGNMVFDRLFSRVGKEKGVHFSLDMVAHEPDWRSSLGWFAERYPAFCEPKAATAAALGGTAAYSNFFDDFDVQKMKRMAFRVNWQASFDFPYMGMFLPPVDPDSAWTRFGKGQMTMREMDAHAQRLKDRGFATLDYFNVTEFGAGLTTEFGTKQTGPVITLPAQAADTWKTPASVLKNHFPSAMLIAAPAVNLHNLVDSNSYHGGPYYSWMGAVAMDCGDSSYQHFLLEQASRLMNNVPHAAGMCIDRLDWLRFMNQNADDQTTWFNNRPARALVNSWKDLMGKIGPLVHQKGKAIFVNNHYKRIDLLAQVDGVFDEFTQATSPLNLTAFLTLYKPALGWTPSKAVIDADGGDNFFQKYLYMAVFPMCPFPGNDHALLPDTAVDRLYLDYGPLMNQLKEKRWVLRPGILKVTRGDARANIFQTKNGYSIPVVYGAGRTAVVQLNDAVISGQPWTCLVYLPGRSFPVSVRAVRKGSTLTISVPLERGAAMLVLTKGSKILKS